MKTKRRYSKHIIKEDPNQFDIYNTPPQPTDGHYMWGDKNSITFIVNREITQAYVISGGSHMDILDYQIFNGEEIEDDEDNEWERKNAFHGRIWTIPRVISFWVQPNSQQLKAIIDLLNKSYPDLMSNIDIIDDYVIEISYDKQKQKSTFVPVKDYINSNEPKTDNNFDKNAIHLMKPEEKTKTPQMQSYLKGRNQNQSEKLGDKNNSREVSPAEYNFYRRYGMGESRKYVNESENINGSIKLYHGTDYLGLSNILVDGVIDARNGKQTGETKGMNWFFTECRNNFSRGYMFSIEMNEEQFKRYQMHFMNEKSVANYEPIPIQDVNFKIEEAFDITYEQMLSMWNYIGKKSPDSGKYETIYKFIELLENASVAIDKEAIYINDNIIIQILKQIMGENNLRQLGITEGIINDVKSDDINLQSFKPKKELNPKFWINGKLNSRVRLRLLDIADDFIDELEINWVKPKDIVFTGSLANYNWSKYSDIDVHILIDYNDVYEKHEFVEDYFKAKKDLWLEEHPNLKIYGYPVELYVEDINNEGVSSGIYSLEKNNWLIEPGDIQDTSLNEKYIKKIAAKLMTAIDNVVDKLKNETDSHKIEVYRNQLYKIFDKIKTIRKDGLKNGGEMSSGNIIFKIIRRTEYFDKLWDAMNTAYDKLNSIKENKSHQKVIIITEEQKKKVYEAFYRNSMTNQNIWFDGEPDKPAEFGGKWLKVEPLKGWECVGTAKTIMNRNYYILVNMNAPYDINDVKGFMEKNVSVNEYEDGSDGFNRIYNRLDSRNSQIQLFDKYKNTFYEVLFYGVNDWYREKKTDDYMSKIFIDGNKVIAHHNSDVKIMDGVVRPGGKMNHWSKNSDWGVYFWLSVYDGRDPSNGGRYTYYCQIPLNEIYFRDATKLSDENIESKSNILKEYSYIAGDWSSGSAVACQTYKSTPIWCTRALVNGKITWYDKDWNVIEEPEILKQKGL